VRRFVVVVAVVVVVVGSAASVSVASAKVWTQLTPTHDVQELYFNAVGASSASDVWVVGDNDYEPSQARIFHWDGTAWQSDRVTGLDPDEAAGLLGVSALSTSDAWAVGSRDGLGSGGVLAAHWDGSSWSAVPTPVSATEHRILDSVSMLSGSNVWAVGAQTSGALVEHWDGTRWWVVTSHGTVRLTSVQAVGTKNVWAVGGDVVEHYNGTKWATVKVPVTSTTRLAQITRVPGTTHLWAVGTDSHGYNAPATPVAIYYNGTNWKAHTPPGTGQLFGVAALSPTDVQASGTCSCDTVAPPNSNVTVRWNGSTWHRVTPAGLANVAVENMTRAPGSTQLWAIGEGPPPGGSFGPFVAYNH
jgi:hypothetical protein